jgi:hypothetical protein
MLREDCKERQRKGKDTGTNVQLNQRAASSLLLPQNLHGGATGSHPAVTL